MVLLCFQLQVGYAALFKHDTAGIAGILPVRLPVRRF